MSSPKGDEASAIAELAMSLPALSRPIIAEWFRKNPDIEQKQDQTPVTIADRLVESALRDAIHKAFPEHNIIGEEHKNQKNQNAYTWVIDPIDGTRAFGCGNPMFGTLIAVLHEGLPLIGIIDLPILNQTWVGIDGQATRLNGEAITTSKQDRVIKARLATTSYDALGKDYPSFEKLSKQALVTSYGGDCANYAHLASGWCDLVAESGLKAYDIMAVIPVIRGSGGVISQWDGDAIRLESYDGTALASASRTLHDEALLVLQF